MKQMAFSISKLLVCQSCGFWTYVSNTGIEKHPTHSIQVVTQFLARGKGNRNRAHRGRQCRGCSQNPRYIPFFLPIQLPRD